MFWQVISKWKSARQPVREQITIWKRGSYRESKSTVLHKVVFSEKPLIKMKKIDRIGQIENYKNFDKPDKVG